jgi:WD40 repeat protein
LGPVTALAFSDDGRWLASSGGDAVDYYGRVSSSDGTTRLWRLTSKDPNNTSTVLVTGSRFPHLAFTPRSDWLAASSDDMSVRLLNMRTLSISLDPLNLGDEFKSIWFNNRFNIQGHWLYYPSQQNTVTDTTYVFLDLASQDPLTTLTTRAIATGPVFSPDGKWLAYTKTVSSDQNMMHSLNALLLENLDAGKLSDPQTLMPAKANHTYSGMIAFSPDSRWLLNINFTYISDWSALSNITLFDLRASDPTRSFQWSEDQIDNTYISFSGAPDTVFSPNNRWLAVNFVSGGRLIDLSQDDPTANPLSMQGTMVISFSPDGQMAAVVNSDGDVGIMNLLAENPIASITILNSGAVPTLDILMANSLEWPILEQLSFSPNGRWLLLVTCDKSQCLEGSKRVITLWDLTRPDPTSSMEQLPGFALAGDAGC